MKLDDFLEIEKEYGLVNDQIDGFAYWTFFRCDLKWDLEKLIDSYDEMYVHPEFSFWKKMKARLGMVKYALCNSRIPKGPHKALILNHERRVWMDDHYECIYTDKIAAEYPGSVVLERPYFQQHSQPVRTKNLVYTDRIELKAMLHFYIRSFFFKKQISDLRKRLEERIREPLDKICKAYQVSYDGRRIIDRMVCGYYIYQVKKKDLGRLIKKINPKVILEVVGYNFDCMVVNELGAELHIPTVELQHGVTGGEHLPYNYAKGTKVKQFAQYFFAFSRFWIEAARYPLPAERLVEAGFPYLEEKAGEVKRKYHKDGIHKIIFISQPMIGDRLAEIAATLNQLIDREKYQIIFKLHPGEYERWKERYPQLAGSDIKVIDNRQTDLYELFAQSEYQVGAYGSTATFEGLEFDLKTFILREGASSEMKLLCDTTWAEFFDTAQELYEMIQDGTKNAGAETGFWKRDALKTVKKRIDDIAGK